MPAIWLSCFALRWSAPDWASDRQDSRFRGCWRQSRGYSPGPHPNTRSSAGKGRDLHLRHKMKLRHRERDGQRRSAWEIKAYFVGLLHFALNPFAKIVLEAP